MADKDEIDSFPLNPTLSGYDEYIEFLKDSADARAQWERDTRVRIAHDTHFIKEIGKFVTPASNTWQDYSLTTEMADIGFDPEQYIFDKAVGQASKNSAIYDPSAFRYKDYAPLRHNLAVMRNFVLNHMYGEELDEVEARDKQKFSIVVQIGHEIGDLLRRGNNFLLANPLMPHVSPKEANVDYEGAVALYKQLLRVQNKNSWLAPLDFLWHIRDREYFHQNWKLPPIELTPFGRLNMVAPPPADSIAATNIFRDGNLALAHAEAFRQSQENVPLMDMDNADLAPQAAQFNSIDSLSQSVKTKAIEIAREILEKLKIQFQGTPFMTVLDYNSDQFPRTMADLNTVIAVYQDHLKRGLGLDPSLKDEPFVMRADEVLGFIGAQIKLRALDRAEMLGNTDYAAKIRSELEPMPARWLNPNSFTSNEVFTALEQAIEMVAVTLHQIQEESMEQNQRGVMLHASLHSPEEQQRRMQSLSFDETYQQSAAARRTAFHAQQGGQHTQNTLQQGSALSDATPSGSKKHGKSEIASSPTTNFDTLLAGAGANLQQMQGSVNAPTSGNFSAAAPGNIQQTIQQAIAHHSKTGTTSAMAGAGARPAHQGQRQQRRTEEQATAARRQNRPPKQETIPPENKDKKPEENPSVPPAGSRRDRNFPGRN